jgi:WD40 repeat protein
VASAGSGPPLILARGVLNAMSWGKPRLAAALILAVGLVASGAGLVARHIPAAAPPAASASEESPAERERVRTDADGDPLPPGALLRLGSARLRHAGLSEDMIFSADGKTLTTTGYDHVVRTWDVADGRLVRARRLRGAADSGFGTLARDLRTAAYVGGEAVHVWDVEAGKELAKLAIDRTPDYVGFSPDGKTLVVGRNFRDVSLWDWSTGAERRLVVCRKATIQFGYGMGNRSCFSPDGKLLATGAPFDQPLSLWDVATGQEVKQLDCPTGVVEFSPDGKQLATATAQPDGTLLRLWDVGAGKEVLRMTHPKENSVNAAGFSRDGKAVAWVGWEATVLMDARTGRELHRWPGRHRGAVFSPNGRTLATASGVTVRLTDLATGKERLERAGHDEGPHSLAVSPDGRSVVATDYVVRDLYVWDLTTGRAARRIPWGDKQGQVRSVGLLADGATLAVGTFGGVVHFFDAATGREQRSITLPDPEQPKDPYFKAVCFPPDGKEVVTLSAWQANQLTRWDAAAGRLLQRHACKPAPDMAHAFAPDGRLLALRTEGGVDVLDVRSGRTGASLKGNWGAPLAFSHDGKLLAAGALKLTAGGPADDRRPETAAVRVWEWAAGRELVTCETGAVQFAALTPDGRWLVTADAQALRVWETATGQEAHRLLLPEVFTHFLGGRYLSSLALTPEGRRAITGLRDGTLLVWDLTAAADRPADLAALWDDLAGEDARRAYRAAWALVTERERAVALLNERLRPAEETAGRVRRLIADLDSEDFAVRQAASRALAGLADDSEPELRKALAGASPEARRRLEEVLSGPRTVRGKETRAAVRAAQVLEAVATPEAREVLRRLARGAPAARATGEAEAALRRLEHGRPAVP